MAEVILQKVAHKVNNLHVHDSKNVTVGIWYLESHHECLSSRSVHLPQEFQPFHGFNDWQRKR